MSTETAKHPRALPFLFFTEMWERFGYYLMIGIFQLYLTDTQSGGLGMDRKDAADIFGTFIAFVYLTPFLGGLLADKKLGYSKSIFIGGTLMGLGYFGLALNQLSTFYISLALIVIGNGFFKPNISTLLGNLYSDPKLKSKKDSGYNIFYMGINIGAFICNFFAAFLRNSIGWGAAFAAAGVGMFLGLIVFYFGTKHYKHADVRKEANKEDMSVSRIMSNVLLPAIAVGIGGWLIPGNIFGSDSSDAFIFAAIPVSIFYASLYFRASAEDKRPLAALLAIFAVGMMFWAIFKQNGTALTTWAQFYTDRSIPAIIEKPSEALYLTETASNKLDSVPLFDDEFKIQRDANKVPIKHLGKDVYFQNLPEEKMPPEGASISLFNTELFQSINPFFIIILTPLVIWFFSWMRKQRREPTTPGKIAWGLLITGISTLAMVAACYVSSNGAIKVSPMWLVSTYGLVTIGEICLSPMGLSLVSKLSPPRLTALMMGGWFLSISIGNKLSGILATLWDTYDVKANFYWVNFGLLMVATIMIFSMLKWLNKIFRENTGE